MIMREPIEKLSRLLASGTVAILLTAGCSTACADDMLAFIDASQVARRVVHSHLRIPVSGTRVTLQYPKWIPGDHSPLNRVDQLAELRFRANGRAIPWRRDLTDAFSFELEVPPGTDNIEADFDVVLPAPGAPLGGASSRLFRFRWPIGLLYPAGTAIQDIRVDAKLKVPAGWGFASSLPVDKVVEDEIAFQPTNIEELVDAPVLTGMHMRTVDLTPGSAVAHTMTIAAEEPSDLPDDASKFQHFSQLVSEARTLFKSEHYRGYRFLVAASDYTGPGAGFEHGESNDTGVESTFFRHMDDPSDQQQLLPHEFMHSWSGKYRRPADLTTDDFQQPQQTDLLWVYEGVTAHLGFVMSARSEMWTADQARDHWASVAGNVASYTSRSWRPLQDTADAVPVTMARMFGEYDWASWTGALDYYDEGALIWLEVNAIISQQSHGSRTLDDFMSDFYGGDGGHAQVKTYASEDVYAALARVVPYDWAGFFRSHLKALSKVPPLGGLERSGWKLVYTSRPNPFARLDAPMFSVGMRVSRGGRIGDVQRGSIAHARGIVPGMTIVKVDGQAYTSEIFMQAISTSPMRGEIELTTRYAGQMQVFKIKAERGLVYPHLERIPGTADLLSPYLAPHARGEASALPAFTEPTEPINANLQRPVHRQ